MEQYLIVSDLWDIVSGVETETSKRADFLRRQKSARAHIALHIPPSQFNTVHLNTNPKRIWEELQHLNRLGGAAPGCLAPRGQELPETGGARGGGLKPINDIDRHRTSRDSPIGWYDETQRFGGKRERRSSITGPNRCALE